MNNFIDMIRKSLELMETLSEALSYMQGKWEEGKWEETFSMMNEFVIGMTKIDSTLRMLLGELPVNRLEPLMNDLLGVLGQTARAYENQDMELAGGHLKQLRGAFDALRNEMLRVLTPYTIS